MGVRDGERGALERGKGERGKGKTTHSAVRFLGFKIEIGKGRGEKVGTLDEFKLADKVVGFFSVES